MDRIICSRDEINMNAVLSAEAIHRGGGRIARLAIGLCVLAAPCYAAAGVPPPLNPNAPMARAPQECHIGAYLLSNGSVVDIAQSNGDTLRWRRFDGTTGALHKKASGEWTSTAGWTDVADGKSVSFGGCDQGSIEFDGVRGARIHFSVRETTFHNGDVALAGRLVMPAGVSKVPVVVLLSGSEQDSALDTFFLQRLLPAHGVGAFVYDKRGTGRSAGSYTQDFSVLADDAVAAMREARRLAGARLTRIGFQGGSQGAWVAPIAANRARVDFVIVGFGLAVSVIDEDQQEVEIEMREKSHSPAEIAQALEVARAAEGVIGSHFTEGFAQLDAMRAKYRGAPWYKDLHGNYTYLLLPYSEEQLRELGRTELSWTQSTPFYYDPMPTLRAATVPQLWILGGEDYEAPSAETRRRLEALIAAGHPFTVAYYANAEHGLTLFDVNAAGERISTRYAPGYFKLMRDFARDGQLTGTYDDAQLTKPQMPGGHRAH
jgi:pimeloyl-ACP methyl ester carboxylesterase